MVDDTLLSIGRRSAEECIASMLILLFKLMNAGSSADWKVMIDLVPHPE